MRMACMGVLGLPTVRDQSSGMAPVVPTQCERVGASATYGQAERMRQDLGSMQLIGFP